MQIWNEDSGLRVGLIAVLFFAGLGLLIYGWTLTGKLSGLGLMLFGVVLLLAALYLYNKPFQDPKERR